MGRHSPPKTEIPGQIQTTAQRLPSFRTINVLFFGFLGVVTQVVQSMNLVTSFPDDLYISKEDNIAFMLKDFINGTRITREVFPEPFVKSPLDDDSVEINQDLLKNCRLTRQTRPLEMISICQDQDLKDVITVHHLKSDLSLMLKYENAITKDNDWEAGETLTNVYYYNGLFFASSKKLDSVRSTFKVKVYMFELIYPKDPSQPFVDANNKNPSPKLKVIGAPLVIPDFMSEDESNNHPVIKVHCVSDSLDFFHCLVCQEAQSYGLKSSKKIAIFKIEKLGQKFGVRGLSQVHTLNTFIDEAGLWDDTFLAVSQTGEVQISFFSYTGTDKKLATTLVPLADKIDLKVGWSETPKPQDYKSDIISWKQMFVRQNQLDPQTGKSRYSSVLAVINQDTFFYCQDVKIVSGKKYSLKDDCKDQVRVKFSNYELNDANYQGKSWLISEIYLEPYLKKAIVGYMFDDGGSAEKILKRDAVKGYFYIDIEQATIQFKDLTQYQASSIGFFNTSYYVLTQNSKRYIYNRRDDEIQVSPPQNKEKYAMMLQASTISNDQNAFDFDYFTINSNVNILKGDYDFVKMNPFLGTTFYDRGWFDLGVNSKTMYGNNPSLEAKLQDHDLPALSQHTRDIEMVHDALLSDSNISKLFMLPLPSSKFGDDFYNRNEDAGKQVYQRVYIFVQFERLKGTPQSTLPVIILECKFPSFEKSGFDGDRKFLLEHYIKDEDPTDVKFDWKKGKSVCTLKKSYETQFNDMRVESVISNRDYFSIIGKKTVGANTETWLSIIELSSKTSELLGAVKLESDVSFCDQQVFATTILAVCNYGQSSGVLDTVNLIGRSFGTGISLNQIAIQPLSKDPNPKVFIEKKFIIVPEDNGVPKFKKGQTIFYGGSTKKVYVVNNHLDSPSILTIDFESSGQGLYASISAIINIDSKALPQAGSPTPDANNFQICPTLSNLVVFNPNTMFVYGINTSATKSSFLYVPTATSDGVKREISKMICSDSDESFQLLLNNKEKGTQIIATYYGFDGTQGSKKLHNEFLMNQNLNDFTFASLIEFGSPSLLTFMYSTQSIFLNQTTLVNINGPQTLLKTDGVVAGKYKLNMTLSNQKTKKAEVLEVEILASTEVYLSNIFPPKVSLTKGSTINMSELMNSQGDIVGMSLYDPGQTLIKIIDRLELKNSFDYSAQKIIVAISRDIVVTRETGSASVQIMTAYNQPRADINLLSVVAADDSYTNCEHINVGGIANDMVLLSFVCFKDFKKKIFLVSFPRKTPTPPEKLPFVPVPIAKASLDFEIGDYHETIIDNFLFITVTEKSGKTVSVTRFNLEAKNGVYESKTIKAKWRKVGDNSLYSTAKFNVFRVFENDELKPPKPKISEPYILAILSPGMSNFEMVRLNFEKGSINYFVDVQVYNQTPLHYIRCKGAKQAEFPTEDSLAFVKDMEEPVVCFGGGTGIKFEEFYLDFKVVEDKRYFLAQRAYSYKLPMLKRYWIDNFKVTDDYILIRGDFGDYLRKSQTGTDYITPIPGQRVKKVLPEPDKVTADNVGKLCTLIYKRKKESIHSIGPLSATSSFLNQDPSGKLIFTSSTLKTSDQGLSLQLSTYELHEDFKVTIVEDLGSSIKRFRVAVKTVEDPPYNTQLTTLILDRDYGVENTNSLLFLFFIFLFFIAVAIYSLRWWRNNLTDKPENNSDFKTAATAERDVDYLAFNDSEDTSSLVSAESRSNTTLTFDEESSVQETSQLKSAEKSEWQKADDSSPKAGKRYVKDAGLIEQKDDLGDVIFGDLVDDGEINESQQTPGFNPGAQNPQNPLTKLKRFS